MKVIYRPRAALYRVFSWVTLLSFLTSGVALGAGGPASPLLITAPPNNALVGGGKVSVTAQFSTGATLISAVRLYVDGQGYQTRKITPAATGSGSFTWNTTKFSNASHELTVEILSNGASFARARARVTVNNSAMDVVPPTVSFYLLRDGDTVSGVTRVGVNASDNVAVSYVQLLIDGEFKFLSNNQPFTYRWDTTTCENGPHSLVASAYDAADNKGFSKPLKIFVKNSVKAVLAAASLLPSPAPEPVVLAPEAPATPPVVSIPMAPKAHVQIAGKAVPSLLAPGPAPVMIAAAPKIETQRIAAVVPSKPVVLATAPGARTSLSAPSGRSVGQMSAPSAAPIRATAAPKLPAVISSISISRPSVTAPSPHVVKIPAAPKSEPVRMAAAPKLDLHPSLPRAVPMGEARVALSPRTVPGVRAGRPATASVAPDIAPAHSAAPTSRAKVSKPVGEPTVSKSMAKRPVAGNPTRILLTRTEPALIADKPATAPKLAPKLSVATQPVRLAAKLVRMAETSTAPMPQIYTNPPKAPKAEQKQDAKTPEPKVEKKPLSAPPIPMPPMPQIYSNPPKTSKVEKKPLSAPPIPMPPMPQIYSGTAKAPKIVAPAAKSSAVKLSKSSVDCVYVVKAGEKIDEIAAKTRVSAQAIRKANPEVDTLAAGRKLRIPVGIRMVFAGEELIPSVAPRLEKGITVAPVRQMVEGGGGVVVWQAPRRRVSAYRGADKVILEIGSKQAFVNGSAVIMEIAPYIEEGRALVPLRFVENALDIAVQFDPAAGVIYMASR